jgi:hypothetical protein
MTRLIAFCGCAGAGKTTAAARLTGVHGYVRAPFAAGLKAMLATLLRLQGADEDEIAELIDGAAKEDRCRYLAGASARRAMQTLGTEWGRAIDQDFWVKVWRGALPDSGRIVVDDLRFANEANAIHDMGGLVVRIDRPDARRLDPAAAAHASESLAGVTPDRVIVGGGPFENLWEQVDDLATCRVTSLRSVEPMPTALAAIVESARWD